MAFGRGGGSASPPSIPDPPPPPPMLNSPQGAQAADDMRRRAANSYGALGTVTTSPQGLTAPANTAHTTLLGG